MLGTMPLRALENEDTSQGTLDRELPEEPAIDTQAEATARARAARGARDRRLLVCVDGAFLGRVQDVSERPCLVGRQQSAELWLTDGGVSRRHALVERRGDEVVLTDQGSANGTYVNGERITERALVDGDLIQFGSLALFRFLVTDPDHHRMLLSLYEASVRDPLTGAFNRDYLQERLRAELSFAKRHGTQVSVVIYDLDHFKQVNDTHGHVVGDKVLVALAALVRDGIRVEDVLVRYGGEEFLLILRDIPVGNAAVVAERLRAGIEALRIDVGTAVLSVTASFGCASLACCGSFGPEALIQTADRRLLAAKRLGRNRVVADDAEPEPGP